MGDYPKLAEVAKKTIGNDVEGVAYRSGLSRATIYNVLGGKRVEPETLEAIAIAAGKTASEQRRIYAGLMYGIGFLNMMPKAILKWLEIEMLDEDVSPVGTGGDDDEEVNAAIDEASFLRPDLREAADEPPSGQENINDKTSHEC